MLGFFKRRRPLDDERKQQFIDAISAMLEAQMVAAGRRSLEESGSIIPDALGYIYGFIDAALRTIGQDMRNTSVGVPITFQVLRGLSPGHEESYLHYLEARMGTDQRVTAAAMIGGQQYIDFNNGRIAAPMGLARYLVLAPYLQEQQ
jgi:hypothetical protein